MELTEKQIKQLQDQVRNVKSVEDLMATDAPLSQLAGEIINGLLEAERDVHLGYPPHAMDGHHTGNSRNGYSKKTGQSARGPLTLKVLRDRNGSFAPLIVPSHTRVLDGVDEQVLSLYAPGMSTRDISAPRASHAACRRASCHHGRRRSPQWRIFLSPGIRRYPSDTEYAVDEITLPISRPIRRTPRHSLPWRHG
ncbi:MAG: transposase [Bacteroidetes bacterium]|nr:transposase [Bacteroidota bacterium]